MRLLRTFSLLAVAAVLALAIGGVIDQSHLEHGAVGACVLPLFMRADRTYAPFEDGGGGGGGTTLSEAEFQGKVLGKLDETKKTVDDLTKNHDQLDKDTKKSIEELHKSIKEFDGTSGQVKDFENKLKKMQLQLVHEQRMANGNPVDRISNCEEKRVKFNALVRQAVGGLGLTEEMKTSLGEDSAPGSTMINDALADDIYDALAQYGIFTSFDVKRLGTKTTKFPVKTARASASWVLAEGGAIPEDTAKAGGSVSLEVELCGALLPVSRQLLEDSEFDVTADVLDDFAQAIAQRIDHAALVADGTADATNGGFTGIFSGGTAITAASGNTTVETLDFEDITKVMLGVDPVVLNRMAKWWTHPQMLVRLLSIKDNNGRPIFLTSLEAPTVGGIGSILGYPVVPSFVAPNANTAGSKIIAFGDPRAQVVGVRKDFEFEASDHASWTTYERTFRGIARAGVKTRKASAIGYLQTAAS